MHTQYNMRNSGTPYMRHILDNEHKGYFFDNRDRLHITVEAAQATAKTHEIVYYGGNREKVAILRNHTQTLGNGQNSLYGAMQVISDEPDMFGNCVRWVSFGLYSANFANPLEVDETDLSDENEELWVRRLMVLTPTKLRETYDMYSNTTLVGLTRIIEAIAIERRIDLTSDSYLETDFTYMRDM